MLRLTTHRELDPPVEHGHMQWKELVYDPLQCFHGPNMVKQEPDRAPIYPDPLDIDILEEDRSLSQTDLPITDPEFIQIFIKMLEGRNIFRRIGKGR